MTNDRAIHGERERDDSEVTVFHVNTSMTLRKLVDVMSVDFSPGEQLKLREVMPY